MTTHHKLAAIAAGATLILSISTAHAEGSWYVGFGAGQSNFDIDTGALDSAAIDAGFGSSDTSVRDDSDTAWKFFGGYRFNENMAVELGYVDLGEASTRTVTTGPNATIDADVDVSAVTLAVLGIYPINESFEVFGKVGAYRWDSDGKAVTTAGGGASVSESDDGVDPMLGLGVSWNATENFAIRAEYEYFSDAGDDDVDMWSASAVFNF